MTEPMSCPCDSGALYTVCCEPYHTKVIPAPTALALMRSRYSAFALGLVDYLIQTTHRKNPHYQRSVSKKWQAELKQYCAQTQFQGLEILNDEPGEKEAFVTFRASLLHQGQPVVFTERSYFLKVGPRWFYHSGNVNT